MVQATFDRLGAVSGITYVYEPHDDGVPFTGSGTINAGILGVRGDIRLAGHFIDGVSLPGVLGYADFPNNGDMVLDTGNDGWFHDSTNNSLDFRSLLMHEGGHALGLPHVESSDGAFLMEPYLPFAFDGPQLDDIIELQRRYGDPLEKNGGNDAVAKATSLGPIAPGESVSRGTLGDSLVVGVNEIDFVSIDDEADLDFYQFTVTAGTTVDITLNARGVSYHRGPQNEPEYQFNPKTQSDLALQLLASDGTTVLQYSNKGGLGGTETISTTLSVAGTYYVRVSGKTEDRLQLYGLNVSSSFRPNIAVRDGAITIPQADWVIDLGSTLPLQPLMKTLTIQNAGTADLILQPATLASASDSGFKLVRNFAANQVLAPGASATLSLRLNRLTPGKSTAKLTINSSDSDAGTFTVDLAGTIATTSSPVPFDEFLDPHPHDDGLGYSNGFGHSITTLSTGNVVISAPWDDAGGTDAGAVYLFNGRTGAIISVLRGSSANDRVGWFGVAPLSTGNFVVPK